MKIKLTLLALVAVCIVACQNQPMLKGDIANASFDKIYLSEVISAYYETYKVVDSAAIVDGKFHFNLENRTPQLYFFGNGKIGSTIFIEAAQITVNGKCIKNSDDDDVINWTLTGSVLNDKFSQYNHKKDSIAQQNLQDKLSAKFQAARKEDKRELMAKIKEEMITIINASKPLISDLTTTTIADNKDNVFGIYLYYTTQFYHNWFHSAEGIQGGRQAIAEFSQEAQQSSYAKKMYKALDKYATCAIGQPAPHIAGFDTLGVAKTLEDYRGKYVIIDFWSSGCSWCRYETPNLLKTYNAFKDKGFTILGVSSDYKKEKWIDAIHEDNSYWDQILLNRKDISPTMERYCIRGIPHIILIDPKGEILEKELRGEDIYKAVAKYMK